MYQFFVDPSQIHDQKVYIDGSDYNHLRNVLRIKIGEEFNVVTGDNDLEYRCAVIEYTDDQAICEIRFSKEADHELPSKVYLFQGLPKADKMESIVQKNVELGAFQIVPVEMKRCVVKLEPKKVQAKTARWQGISEAAAKQSKRGVIPEVKSLMSYSEAIAYAKDNCDVLLLPYEMAEGMEGTRELLKNIEPGQSIAVFIGPEGGFDPKEIDIALEAGFKTITLGKRILRTETAGMTLMSVLMFQLEQ